MGGRPGAALPQSSTTALLDPPWRGASAGHWRGGAISLDRAMSALGQKRTSLHSITSSARRRAEAIDADCKVMCWRGRPTFLLSYLNSVPYLRAIALNCSFVLDFSDAPGEVAISRKNASNPGGATTQSKSNRNRHSQKRARCSWE